MNTKHSPLPFMFEVMTGGNVEIRDAQGNHVAFLFGAYSSMNTANAEFIINACNNFERLVAACEVALQTLKHDDCWSEGQPASPSTSDIIEALVVCPACRAEKSIRAALDAVNGKAVG